jgi:hypothetical protein
MSPAMPNRRQTRRRRHIDEHGIVSARVQPGQRARLIDVSAGGALIETSHRLLPGASVELHVETNSRRTSVRGRVLRCAVVRVRPTWVCYEGAIGFDHHLPWFVDEAGYLVPSVDARSAPPFRGDATPQVI